MVTLSLFEAVQHWSSRLECGLPRYDSGPNYFDEMTAEDRHRKHGGDQIILPRKMGLELGYPVTAVILLPKEKKEKGVLLPQASRGKELNFFREFFRRKKANFSHGKDLAYTGVIVVNLGTGSPLHAIHATIDPSGIGRVVVENGPNFS
ncbi:hypothetical protein B0H17DRAFT_1133637 [Mycena rosella]|uniref:Uncharacterized protein n=1 Tax=Mycena rosella TaxID=1033263 RepID=A0AAD7GER7_MYCRO|nr:hypothetical protein B0H17DRAFT_1133637 [Mycena rosella]